MSAGTKSIDKQEALKIINTLKREDRSREEIIRYASKYFNKAVISSLYSEFFDYSFSLKYNDDDRKKTIQISVPQKYIMQGVQFAIQGKCSTAEFVNEIFSKEFDLLILLIFGDVEITEIKNYKETDTETPSIMLYRDFIISPNNL